MKQYNITRREFINKSGAAFIGLMGTNALAFQKTEHQLGLKDLFINDFRMGTALSKDSFVNDALMKLINKEYNAITATNGFKWALIHPEENEWNFEFPDTFVKYGLKQNMFMLGHVLVWHSQAPDSLFKNSNNKQVSKQELIRRMETHIGTLVDRYKGKLEAWDVVNEAVDFSDFAHSANGWRKSQWLEIMGPGFVDLAFNLAHEADPHAHLIYNDYEMQNVGRRDFVVEMIRDLKKKKVPIHGIGMQVHANIDSPSIQEIDAAITAFAREEMRIHITEMDVDVLPMDWDFVGADIATRFKYKEKLNPYVNGLPKKIEDQLARRYEDLFKLFLKHRDSIDRVTTWGTYDGESWKNSFPIPERTNYPLLFDREMQPKPAYKAIAKLRSQGLG